MKAPIQQFTHSELATEIWLPVVGFEELYEVSSLGRLRGLDRFIGHSTGNERVWTARIIQPERRSDGYLVAKLCKDGVVYRPRLHRVVLEAFVGERPAGMDCCHRNCIRYDNRIENLRWDTRKNNMRDSVRNGTISRGSRHHNSILTEDSVRSLRRDIAALEAKYGVSLYTMAAIKTGRIWGHVK